jgi:glycosyltransferase involved in cell wall biosynthesis
MTDTSHPRVSVVIPAWNAADTLARALEAVAAQRLEEPYEVVVVDNGSDDATPAILAVAPGPVRVVRREHGLAGEARNDGVTAARGEILAFTDADCFPEPSWLAAGLEAIEGADLVQGRVLPDPAARMAPFDRSLWVDADAGLYQTANLFVRRERFDAVGGFEELHDDPHGRAFGEDVWLGWRLRRAGARAAFCSDAVVHHAVLPRGAGGYVLERDSFGRFALLASRIPELRETFFFRRLFLSRRTAAFDGALAAAALAALSRSPLPLAGAAPYALTIARRSLQSGRRAPLVAPVEVAADVVCAASLVRNGVRHRTAVL